VIRYYTKEDRLPEPLYRLVELYLYQSDIFSDLYNCSYAFYKDQFVAYYYNQRRNLLTLFKIKNIDEEFYNEVKDYTKSLYKDPQIIEIFL
jgi:hypothetical protein